MLRIHFLGTGDAIASPSRSNTSLLLEFDETLVLIDCSGSPIQAILKAKCDLDKLSYLIFTHAHIDHTYAFPSLVHGLWLRKLKFPGAFTRIKFIRNFFKEGNFLHVFGLEETLNVVDNLLNIYALKQKFLSLKIKFKILKPLENETKLLLQLKAWKIYVFKVKHLKMASLGLILENEKGEKILFTGDATIDNRISSRLDHSISILIQDCGGGLKSNFGHAGANEINTLIKTTKIKQVYLTHLPDLKETPIKRMVEVVSSEFLGNVIVPNDGDYFEVQ